MLWPAAARVVAWRRGKAWATATLRELFQFGLVVVYSLWCVHAYAQNAVSGTESRAKAGSNDLVAAGRLVFFDKSLSSDSQISCANCHQPDKHFSDGLPRSKGVDGRLGTRNAPSLINVASVAPLFWDGRASTLEEQALQPFLNPREMGLKDEAALLVKIKSNPKTASALKAALELKSLDNLTAGHVAQALAAYERTLTSKPSAFEQYLRTNDSNAMSAGAVRGYKIFTGSAECISCHVVNSQFPLLTDNQFHTLSIGLDRINTNLATLVAQYYKRRSEGESLDQIILSNNDFAELGRFVVTLKPDDIGKFKTPSLRNVAMTAPYMHDGSVATLEDAVDHEIYYRSLQRGRPLIVTPAEKADLTEFLRALTEQ